MNPETFPAPVLNGGTTSEDHWQREYQTFRRMLPDLLQTHRNRYVAILNEQVVETGEDLVEVASRSYAKHGYVAIYVGLVTDQPEAPVRIPSPRLAAVSSHDGSL